MREIIYSENEIYKSVELILNNFEKCSVFAFSGVLGAGKTTLIQAVLKECRIKEEVVSPTYTYVIKYVNSKNQTFYHFDLYRIKTLEEFIDMGFHEYLFAPDSWCFIEWPDVIMPLLNHKTCFINIDYTLDFKRSLTYQLSSDLQKNYKF